jgi:pimeloyl-ACP methyl ester carboxylesterase
METVTSRDGTSIAFDRVGTGSPLVLVAGALQRAIDLRTAQLAELLAADFAVYHYDRRGSGDSADKAPYDVDREIDDIDALIEHAGEFAVVFGISSGAVLALQAACAGVAIRKLALYEPPFIVDDSPALPADYLPFIVDDSPALPADYPRTLTKLVETERRGEAVAYFLTDALGLPDELVAAMRAEPFWPAFANVAHTLVYDGAVMADTSSGSLTPLEQWSPLNVPTLVLDGGESAECQRTACDLLAAMLSRAERQTLTGQAHEVNPNVLAPVLFEFFTAGNGVTAGLTAS